MWVEGFRVWGPRALECRSYGVRGLCVSGFRV